MRKTYRNLQFLSNIATVVIAVLLCVITVKLFVSPSTNGNIVSNPKPNEVVSNTNTPSAIKPPAVNPLGKPVPLENVNWKENKKTLVLYLSTSCRYCNESSPFYKQLLEKFSNDKNVKLIAVLPQPVDESKEHLKGLGVNIENVYNAQLSSMGVAATPTLLIVNESGVVSEYWRGKLNSDREKEVINKLSS